MYIKYEYIVKANASSEASYARKYVHNVTYARIHTHTHRRAQRLQKESTE